MNWKDLTSIHQVLILHFNLKECRDKCQFCKECGLIILQWGSQQLKLTNERYMHPRMSACVRQNRFEKEQLISFCQNDLQAITADSLAEETNYEGCFDRR